jgi:hypothetical protein
MIVAPSRGGAWRVAESSRGSGSVLYALPSEQWRIDAYLLLWKTAKKLGWNEGFGCDRI